MSLPWRESRVAGGALFVAPAVFSSDMKYFFTVSSVVRVFSVETGEFVRPLQAHVMPVTGLALSTTNPLQLFTASTDGTIKQWDYSDATVLKTIDVGSPVKRMIAPSAAPTTTAVLLLRGEEPGQDVVATIDLEAENPQPRRVAYLKRVSDMAVSSDGSYVAVVSGRKLIVVNAAGELRADTRRGPPQFLNKDELRVVAFDPQDDCIATGDSIGRVILWQKWEIPPTAPSSAESEQEAAPDTAQDNSQSEAPASVPPCSADSAEKKRLFRNSKQRRMLQRKPSVNFTAPVRKEFDRVLREQSRTVVTRTLHWHSHAVLSLAFYPDGSHLLTGGDESVLVAWQLKTGQRRFLPRIGAPIAAVSVSPDSQLYALGLYDNSLKIVSATTSKAIHVIRGLLRMRDTPGAWAGLSVEPRDGLVVMNGVPNTLQFYDVRSDRFVRELEVAPPNAVRRDVDNSELLPFACVEHAAFATPASGEWLVTVDRLASEWSGDESSLKFWKYDPKQQTYKLYTRVDSPHGKAVTGLVCHPTKLAVVTTSTDTRFKGWVPAPLRTHQPHQGPAGSSSSSSSSDEQRMTWRCRSVGYYRGMPCNCAAFSSDGSVLAVGAGSAISLWDAETNELQFSLCHTSSSDILRVAFVPQSPLLLSNSSEFLYVWDPVSRSLLWSYSARVVNMAIDPLSSLFAVIVASDNQQSQSGSPHSQQPPSLLPASPLAADSSTFHHLAVFDAHDPAPQAVLRLCRPALSLSFLPPTVPQPGMKSSLVYLNDENELLLVEPEGQETEDAKMEEDGRASDASEPKSMLERAFSKKVVEEDSPASAPEVSASDAIDELLAGPTHALPSFEKLLGKILALDIEETEEAPEDKKAGEQAAQRQAAQQTRDEEENASKCADEAEDEMLSSELSGAMFQLNEAVYGRFGTFFKGLLEPGKKTKARAAAATQATPDPASEDTTQGETLLRFPASRVGTDAGRQSTQTCVIHQSSPVANTGTMKRARAHPPATPSPAVHYVRWDDSTLQRTSITTDFACTRESSAALRDRPGTELRLVSIGHCTQSDAKSGIAPFVRVFELSSSSLDRQSLWYHESLVEPSSIRWTACRGTAVVEYQNCHRKNCSACPEIAQAQASATHGRLHRAAGPAAHAGLLTSSPVLKRHRPESPLLLEPGSGSTTPGACAHRARVDRVLGAVRIGEALWRVGDKTELTLFMHVYNLFPGDHHGVMGLISDRHSRKHVLAELIDNVRGDDSDEIRMWMRVGYAHGMLWYAWNERCPAGVEAAVNKLHAENIDSEFNCVLREFSVTWKHDYDNRAWALLERLRGVLLAVASVPAS
eukprot:m51a1_g508 putative 3-ketoacyl-CoA thiolase (1323) ;mRNA; f:297747-303535